MTLDVDDLHDVLDRATDAVAPVGMAARALSTARRRRTRRRGIAAGLASAAAVAGVVVAVQGAGGPTAEPPASPATTTTAPPTPAEPLVAPDIPLDRIQDRWDPRGAEGLPVLDLGIPRVLPLVDGGTGAVGTAVALLESDGETLLVGPDGTQAALDLPDGLGTQRSVRLSPDGRRVAAVGSSGFFWRDLDGDIDGGSWERVEVPAHAREGSVGWLPGSAVVVLQGYGPGVRVDLATGATRLLPHLAEYVSWAADPEGRLTYQRPADEPSTTGAALVSEDGDGGTAEAFPGPLESIQRYALSDSSLAAARANGAVVGGRPAAHDVDGLIALDRATLATRALLPVEDRAGYYADGGHLVPTSWLDDDTVLFTVLPRDAAKEYLLAWDVESGDLSRVACWPTAYDASFASDLATRR
ncbi:hypothetical protein [Nocardioides dongxiaopingii]|uniref:hypothetical protein n=1 Tax=Nocardioides dongxiaopingii TaxID=2576036 RepID=UPI0010C762B3|nr:hypothetical protein [Nocardioides dongxiaopingii]